MNFTIHLNGQAFKAKENNTTTALEFKDLVYKNMEKLEKMEVETDRGFIVLGVSALQSAVLEFTD